MLKHKFQKLHQTVVKNVNAASIMDVLFQEAVIGLDDMRRLVGWLVGFNIVSTNRLCRAIEKLKFIKSVYFR